MKPFFFSPFPVAVLATALGAVLSAQADEAPDIVWEAPTPSGLANSIQGVGWSPVPPGRVAFGSTDRWLRTREAETGALLYSILQPHRSGNANQTVYSTDGAFIAVHNSGGGLGYRVHRASDGLFLGTLTVQITADLVRFAPDAQLLASVGGDGTLSRWPVAELTVSVTVGSGYDRTNTTFNFSANGDLQSAASLGSIKIQRRSDGGPVRVLAGGSSQGASAVAFSPDGTRLAAWNETSKKTTLWRITDGAALIEFAGVTNEGVGAVRFTPDGTALVTTGYQPFVGGDGLWQQKGVIRFWRVADGVLLQKFDARTGLAVTSPIAWSPDASQFAYGTYEGTAVVARTPASVRGAAGPLAALTVLPDGNVQLIQSGVPGSMYHVEATTNLLAWREVGRVTADANGSFQFLDTNCHGCSMRLYRFWRTSGP
jgi:WD40 repeat protein